MAHFYFENVPHGKRKNGEKLNTKMHYDYICREGEYEGMRNREEDLVFKTSGNMPLWADNSGDFWEQAELHRSKNGRAYREFRFALQEELSLEENMALVEQFLKETGIKDNHAYSYAIHDKEATFDKDHRNIHCHLMFNEKIIEPNRKLGPDKYFKNYAQNVNGEPTQGYRTSTYFDRKSTTYELRTKWADMVNAKFKEKGLDCSVSEKSLDKQAADLFEEGREEEADLLKRTPAPHLGSSYRNPKTMEKIMEKIKEVNEDVESAAASPDNKNDDNVPRLEEYSHMEKNILLFAHDFVIRKIAKEIQEERLNLLKEQELNALQHEAAEIMDDPMIITVENIYDYATEKSANYEQAAANKLADYNLLRKNLLDDKKIALNAKEILFDNQYGKTVNEYINASKKLESLKSKVPSLYGHTDKAAELVACSRSIQELTAERSRLGKQIQSFKAALAGEKKDQFGKISLRLKFENEGNMRQSKKLYSEYCMMNKEAQKYKDIANMLKDQDMEQILFTEKLPSMLTRKCKIKGIKPISKMPMAVLDGESYAILYKLPDKLSEESYIKGDNGNICIVEAVKIGDDIQRGKVPVYNLTFNQQKDGTWKPHTVSLPYLPDSKTGQHTPKQIALYKTKAMQPEKETKQHPIIQKATQQRRADTMAKVSKIAENIVKDDKVVRINGHWQEEDHLKKDKTKAIEEKLYSGWSL